MVNPLRYGWRGPTLEMQMRRLICLLFDHDYVVVRGRAMASLVDDDWSIVGWASQVECETCGKRDDVVTWGEIDVPDSHSRSGG